MDAISRTEQAIAALEAQRQILGDEVVDISLEALKSRLTELQAADITMRQQQRKVATLLFCDVVGSTRLVQDLDPEDNMEIMEGALVSLAEVIESFGGHIARYQGDGFKAIFGLPIAHENDPENAIRAGLGLIETAQEYAFKLEAERNLIGFNIRVGINSGLVVAGGVTEAKDSISGLVVNLAARLESAAPPGSILISHYTYQHVRGIFDVEPQEPIHAKGFPEPVPVYLVRRAKPRSFRLGRRGIENLETRMIGRDRELQVLQDAYLNTTIRSQTTVVTIVGEAGVGKSRLADEFTNWLELRPEPIWYFKGRANQRTQNIPHFVLRFMLADRFQILNSDSLDILRAKFVVGISKFLSNQGEMKAHILGTWLGYDFSDSPHLQPIRDEPEQIKNRATLYLAQFFTAVANENPTVVLLEDVHWADQASLDVLTDLTRRRSELPLLITCLTRHALYERLPGWGEMLPAHNRLELTPLSSEDTRALVAEILRLVDPLPPLLVDLISNRAEGNPFYAEELVKMLIDDGIILTGIEQWQVLPEQLLELKVPASLTGVLQARLDRLRPQEKQAVQQAAVIGRIFWDQALAALQAEGQRMLPVLQAKEFIYPHSESAFAGTKEYFFKHALMRDVTYETVLKRVRGQYHALVADWLIATAEANSRCDEYAALIGEHFQLAGDRGKAAEWFGRAGELAARTYAHQDALRYFNLALLFTPEDDHDTRFVLLEKREKVNHMQGNREAQREDLAQLVSLADDLGLVAQARVQLRKSHYALVISDFPQAMLHAQKAIEFVQCTGEKSLAAEGHNALGMALYRQAKYPEAREQFNASLCLAQDACAQKQIAKCFQGLGNIAWDLGDYTTAGEYHQKSLAISREIGNKNGEGSSLDNLGTVAYYQGDLPLARNYFTQSLAVKREIGNRYGEGMSLNNLGTLAYFQEDYAAAREYYEQSLAIKREIGNRAGEGSGLNNLGDVARSQGDINAAREYLEKSLAISRELGDQYLEASSLNGLGIVACNQGDHHLAEEHITHSLKIRQKIGDRNGEGRSLYCLGVVAMNLGNLDQSETCFQDALLIHQELKQPQYLSEFWSGLAKLKLALGDRQKAQEYCQQILDYLEENPHLEGAENPMQAFCFTWEVLQALDQTTASDQVLAYAGQILQEYLDKNSDPDLQAMYLSQPHHAVLWAAWKLNKDLSG